jgi:hydrogenase large subunit
MITAVTAATTTEEIIDMATIKVLDPVSRIEGHLKLEVTIDTSRGVQQVVDAKTSGTMFRGFEEILKTRSPMDAPHITQRICGVCPVSHGMASTLALEQAAGVTPARNGRIMRNLVLAANFIQSHILHFYHLAAIDYVDGPNQPPWQPSWKADKRVGGAAAAALVNHYVQALDMRRKAHEMGALFGGRLPHPPAFIPGGITTTPRAERITQYGAYLDELTDFIQNVYLNDVAAVASVYGDYFKLGGGWGNLIAYGVFDLDDSGANKLLRRGACAQGERRVSSLDIAQITESVGYSWYNDSTNNLNPSRGQTVPVYPKKSGYSWLKAPRLSKRPHEAGPLARMRVNGDYKGGVSVMDRHAARAAEALKIAAAAADWLTQIDGTAEVCTPYVIPQSGTGVGLTEAPRGALGHWLNIAGGSIANYQIITPTCWNASPKDSAALRGPIEQALMGTPIKNINEPIELIRIIHSFDPCLSCAVHVARPDEKARVINLGQCGPAQAGAALAEMAR